MDVIVAYLKIRGNKVGPFFQFHDGTLLSIEQLYSYPGAPGLASPHHTAVIALES